MKVLIVVGAKKNGNTDQLVKQFAKGAASAGHDVDIEYLFGKEIHGCIDCQTCMRTGVCIWKDDFPAMLEKVMGADVIGEVGAGWCHIQTEFGEGYVGSQFVSLT